MIKANELRLGNWFSYDEIKEEVYDIFFDTEEGVRFINDYNADFISPIPLTPEILEKAGFVGKTKEGKDFKLHDLMTMQTDNKGDIILRHSYFMNDTILRNIDLKCSVVKYVHEYQNLYFSLTGFELEINLNP